MQIFKKISSIFKTEPDYKIIDISTNDLKNIYLKSEFKEQGILCNFPSIVSLLNSDINAAYMLTLVNEKSFNDLYDIFRTYLNLDITYQISQKTIEINGIDSTTFVRIQKDFNGYLIGLVTNNTLLLNQIIQAKIEVVPPWVATSLEPEDFVFPQGKEEYYWNTFWLRFYEGLNSTDFKNYLNTYDVPNSWLEYFSICDLEKNLPYK